MAYSKTRPTTRPVNKRGTPADDYDENPAAQYDEYDEYDNADGYYEEESVVTVNRGRALALSVSAIMVIAIFAAAIWLLAGRSDAGQGGKGPVADVPTIQGFNATTAGENQAPTKGAFAPDFVWQQGGKTMSLSSFRSNKPVFVNFWGTWCPPCKAEMPEMQNLYNARKNEVEIVGVSMGPRDWPAQVLNFVNLSNYNWRFIHDNDYGVATRYQVVSIPSSYFIDKNGVIQAVHVGAMTRNMMDSYLQLVH